MDFDKSKSNFCPQCGATEIEFIAPGIGRCKYCGGSIELPKDEIQRDPNNPFDALGSLFDKGKYHDPRASMIEQIYYPLSTNEAQSVKEQAFKKTSRIWIASAVCLALTIAMIVCASICLCSSSAVAAILVPMAFAVIATITAIVITDRHIKKLLKDVQQNRVDEVSKDLEKRLCAPLTSGEIEKALSSTGKHRFSLILKKNTLQLIVCIACPIVFLASIIATPIIAGNHIDTKIEGVCDRCDFDLHGDYIFTLNADGQSYTLTGVTGIFDGNSSLANENIKVTIPSSHLGLPVTTIGAGAFSNKGNHYTLVIPSSITLIQAGAFAQTDLWEIEFEGKNDWYLVEADEWLTEHSSLYPTPSSFRKATFIHYGEYTWSKEFVGCYHEYSGACDSYCNLCNQFRRASRSHTYSSICDDTCNVCGETTERGQHTDVNGDGYCEWCGEAM